MTYPDPRTQPSGDDHPVWPPQQAPDAPKKSRLPLILTAIAALAVVIVAAVITTLAVAGRDRTVAAPKPVATAAGAIPIEGCGSFCDDPTPTPAAGPILTKADIKLSTKITDKQCFGSAGCSITLKVIADHVDRASTLSPDETWEVTYEIRGVEDGPVIGSFEITGEQYTVNEEDVSTTSSKSKISIKVTDIEKVGL